MFQKEKKMEIVTTNSIFCACLVTSISVLKSTKYNVIQIITLNGNVISMFYAY